MMTEKTATHFKLSLIYLYVKEKINEFTQQHSL